MAVSCKIPGHLLGANFGMIVGLLQLLDLQSSSRRIILIYGLANYTDDFVGLRD